MEPSPFFLSESNEWFRDLPLKQVDRSEVWEIVMNAYSKGDVKLRQPQWSHVKFLVEALDFSDEAFNSTQLQKGIRASTAKLLQYQAVERQRFPNQQRS